MTTIVSPQNLPRRTGPAMHAMAVDFFGSLWRQRRLIVDLAHREFRARFLGSALGFSWALLHPAITILLFWFVMQYCLKVAPIKEVPFVLWLMAGLVPWFLVSEAINGGMTTILDNRYLVKKVVFRVNMLPVIRLLANLPIHFCFVGAIFLLLLLLQHPVSWHALQLPYYLLASLVLMLGLSWLTSALAPFFKDVVQIVPVLMQFLFWLTPITWNEDVVPEHNRWLLSLNPAFYVVRGYRDALINKVWFWDHTSSTLYFWSLALFLLVAGGLVFRRLRPQFADVL